jgi:HEPN domain-containing protein
MSKTNLETARGLIRKAENDCKVVSIGLDHGVPLDMLCFHIQQAAEKLLKALLAWRGVDFPFTHDLRDLLVLAVTHFPVLEEFRAPLPKYTVFAVAYRYDDAVLAPEREEVLAAFETVNRLRTIAHSLLPPEARP